MGRARPLSTTVRRRFDYSSGTPATDNGSARTPRRLEPERQGFDVLFWLFGDVSWRPLESRGESIGSARAAAVRRKRDFSRNLAANRPPGLRERPGRLKHLAGRTGKS